MGSGRCAVELPHSSSHWYCLRTARRRDSNAAYLGCPVSFYFRDSTHVEANGLAEFIGEVGKRRDGTRRGRWHTDAETILNKSRSTGAAATVCRTAGGEEAVGGNLLTIGDEWPAQRAQEPACAASLLREIGRTRFARSNEKSASPLERAGSAEQSFCYSALGPVLACRPLRRARQPAPTRRLATQG